MDKARHGDPATNHPIDLLTHMRVEHHLGMQAIHPDIDRATLELAHAQRHGGFGVGADHPADSHKDALSFD